MSRRNIVLIIAFILLIIVMIVAGNVIVVAQRLAEAANFPPLEYIIYITLALLFGYIFLLPIVRIHMAPEFPKLSLTPGENLTALSRLAASLAKTMAYIPDSALRASHTADFRRRIAMSGTNAGRMTEAIEDELLCRFDGSEELGVKGINSRIKEWATTVFMVTAVSQNAKFDSIGIVYFDIRMIADLVRAAGFRPTLRQMFRIYANVAVTGLLSFMFSSALENTGSISPFGNIGADDVAGSASDAADDMAGGLADAAGDATADDDHAFSLYSLMRNIRIPGVVVGSALDGAANALMTMRLGYITASYLKNGADSFRGMKAKRAIRRQAMLASVRTLPSVIVSGSSVIGKNVADLLLKIYK